MSKELLGPNVGTHDYIDILSIVGLVTSTLGAVFLANRLAQHHKLEDKVNEHETRIGKLEVGQNWLERLFKRE